VKIASTVIVVDALVMTVTPPPRQHPASAPQELVGTKRSPCTSASEAHEALHQRHIADARPKRARESAECASTSLCMP